MRTTQQPSFEREQKYDITCPRLKTMTLGVKYSKTFGERTIFLDSAGNTQSFVSSELRLRKDNIIVYSGDSINSERRRTWP